MVTHPEGGQETGVISDFPSDDFVEYEADGHDEDDKVRRIAPRQRVEPL
jgi:hypothetical protein